MADQDSDFDKKLYFEDGMHFSMGSWGVVTLNLPRAAYKSSRDQDWLFSELRALMDVAVEVFKIKLRWMDGIKKTNRMPFATQRPRDPITGERGAMAVDFDGLVYTIGIVGLNEMVQHMTGKQLHESDEAFRLGIRTMTELELYAKKISVESGMTIALARTPAETTGQRFAVSDLLRREFSDAAMRVVKGNVDAAVSKLHVTRDLPIYYTNGTHVTPSANISLQRRAELEHIFFPIVDGGNIFHIWLGEGRSDPRGMMEMAMKLCRSTQIGYFAFTRDLTVSLHEFKRYTGSKTDLASWSVMADKEEVQLTIES
jgi:ribonucleoside-triphosphate reductase